MRIRLDKLFVGISLALMSSTMTPAMASGTAASQDVPGQETTQAGDVNVELDDFAPMTRSERFRNYLTGTFGPKALNKTAASAEIMQLRNVPKEWAKNPAGFGTRLGSAFAEHFIRGTLQYGASAALHEDNRYRRSGKKGFWKRTGYALSSTFLARRDNGHRRFAFSRIGSAGGTALISRAWLPPSIATVGAGMSSFGALIAIDAGTNVFREFWPELKRNFRGK
jgi:hypothetical protein